MLPIPPASEAVLKQIFVNDKNNLTPYELLLSKQFRVLDSLEWREQLFHKARSLYEIVTNVNPNINQHLFYQSLSNNFKELEKVALKWKDLERDGSLEQTR